MFSLVLIVYRVPLYQSIHDLCRDTVCVSCIVCLCTQTLTCLLFVCCNVGDLGLQLNAEVKSPGESVSQISAMSNVNAMQEVEDFNWEI